MIGPLNSGQGWALVYCSVSVSAYALRGWKKEMLEFIIGITVGLIFGATMAPKRRNYGMGSRKPRPRLRVVDSGGRDRCKRRKVK